MPFVVANDCLNTPPYSGLRCLVDTVIMPDPGYPTIYIIGLDCYLATPKA